MLSGLVEVEGSMLRLPAFMDKVADTYGPVQRNVNKILKKALDPTGILAQGKPGIR